MGVHTPSFLMVPSWESEGSPFPQAPGSPLISLPSATQIFVKHPKSSTAQKQQQDECYSLLNTVETIRKEVKYLKMDYSSTRVGKIPI